MDASRWPQLRSGGAALSAFLAVSAPAVAPATTDGSEVAPAGRLEEIIVTARRREERLHEVPIAVSVFSQTELDSRRIVDLDGLQHAAPSMIITTDQTNRATALVAMRGQFEPMSVPTLDPTVGVYLDGVYIARSTGANLRLVDMERVEVLRGPQGTLFGRNTIGGAINLVPKAPSSELEGYVAAGAGNYARRELTGMLNLPFGEGRHAFRLVAAHVEHDGFGRSVLLGRELNDENTDYARAQLHLAPGAMWELNLAGDFTRFENGGQLWALLAVSPGAGLVTAATGRPDDDIRNYLDPVALDVMANRAGSVDTSVAGVSATLTYFGPQWTFKSITAGRRVDSLARDVDQDGTPYDLAAVLRRDDDQDQFSQELQVSGYALGERIDWIAGALYFREKGLFDQEFLAFVPLIGAWQVILPNGSVRNDSLAAYVQLGFAVTPSLRITGGLRVNEDGRQLTSRNAVRLGAVDTCRLEPAIRDSPELCRATLPEQRFRYSPYLLGLDFQPAPRTLLYGKISRGYRAGGYNLRGATARDLAPFGPERVTAWEAGAKGELFTSQLRFDLAIFRSHFDEIQLLQRRFIETEGQSFLFIENGGEARIDGGELELTALLGQLRLSGALGLVDARYTRLHPEVVQVDRDSRFLHTPDTTAAFAADWPVVTAFGRIELHVDYAWRDDVHFEYDRKSVASQEAYGLWNARLELRLAEPGLCVNLWGRNLGDKRHFTRAINSGTFISTAPGDPRTWGTELRYPCARG